MGLQAPRRGRAAETSPGGKGTVNYQCMLEREETAKEVTQAHGDGLRSDGQTCGLQYL